MLSIKVNDQHDFTIDPKESFDWDLVKTGDNTYHIIKDNRSYNAIVLGIDREEKTIQLRIDDHEFTVSIKDRYDMLLKQLGMENTASSKVNQIKAPMPGLVLDIQVEAGTEVQKGDPVMILEAMKMENVLKSPGDGKVKSIAVAQGEAVEKNQLLVEME